MKSAEEAAATPCGWMSLLFPVSFFQLPNVRMLDTGLS